MIRELLLIACCVCAHVAHLAAQADTIPVSAVIHANNIRATVWSNGLLFTDGQNGAFFPDYTEQGPNISPIQAAGLWISLQDPGGSVSTDIVRRFDRTNDFIPGRIDPNFMQHRDFNKIWKVTREEILAHIADYQDNAIIDNPIPAIFAWPGRKNPFFEQYNEGMLLPKVESPEELAPFWDFASSAAQQHNQYEPNKGDYPCLWNTVSEFGFPSEMLWFSFHNTQRDASENFHLVEIHGCVNAYGCGENELLNNTVVISYTVLNRSVETFCTNLGMWADMAIGCPDDDYMGSMPEADLVYAYNSDNLDKGCLINGYGENPPALGIRWVAPYACYQSSCHDEIKCNTYGVFINENPGAPPGQTFPYNNYEIYGYLNGNWRDGSPITFGGSGYLTGNWPVSHIFSGDPSDPAQWSEISANRPPGKRNILNALGTLNIPAHASMTALAVFTFARESGNNYLDNIRILRDSMQHFTTGIVEGPNALACNQPLPVDIKEPALKGIEKLKIFPNPANREIHVKAKKHSIRRITLMDTKGQMVLQTEATENPLSVTHLSSGLYILRAELENGSIATGKMSIVR